MSRKIAPNRQFLQDITGGDSDPIFGASRNAPQIVEADIERIEANPSQPRSDFDESELKELAASIDRHGLQQPIGLRQLDVGRWQLVYGERRLRACRDILKQKTIFGILVSSGDPEEIALVENIQRSELSAIEEAVAYERLMQKHGHSQATIGEIVGRDRTQVNKVLGLLRLPQDVRKECVTFKPAPPRYKLFQIAAEKDEGRQREMWEDLKREFLPASDGASGGAPSPARKPRQAADIGDKTMSALIRVARVLETNSEALRPSATLDEADRARLLKLRDALDAVLASGAST